MDKIQELFRQARAKAEEAKALALGENFDEDAQKKADALLAESEALRKQANTLKAAQGIVDEANAVKMPAALPTDPEPGLPQTDEDAVKKAVNLVRFGEIDDPTDKVMREIYGGDFRQKLWEQDVAFAKYLRTGKADRILTNQFWGPDDVTKMLRDGMTVRTIKATMVEGQDVLGGYAVPPQRANEILRRLPGLTAVRGGGALIVDTTSNMIEWLKVTGPSSGTRYPSGLTGAWGAETQSPTEKNFELSLEQIPVHVYTFKVPMSQSLIEDAANLVTIFTELVSQTLAIDEDDAFLVGDGAGKPKGILPDSANGHSLTEKNSGHASELKVDGVKKLRRGIASQYRATNRAVWIGNSATAEVIELFQDGMGRFYFEYLDEGERFLRHRWRESEAMPDIAANAYPLIFGDLSGYAIVQRLGLSVVRFQDAYTGINKVEFHVRRRLGGNVIEPYKFAVQKVSA